MIYRHSWSIACAALLALAPTAYAQGVTPTAGQPEIPGNMAARTSLSLTEALMQAPASTSDVTLYVSSERAEQPKASASPAPDDRAPRIAQLYGYLAQDFHGVTAIAPPTMMVFNTNLGKPNPYDGMPASEAFKMLLGGLNDIQWKQITGKSGLGLIDLTSDDQRNLFQALFPDKTLSLYPRTGGLGFNGSIPETPKLTQEDIAKARLRIGERVRMLLPIEGKTNTQLVADAPITGATSYSLQSRTWDDDGRETLYGAQLRATVPNALKVSDLDYDKRSLSDAIDLAGIKTVGDLIVRIGVTTRLELYADQRYEKQNVLLLGPQSARAKDLLQALALCVRGAYRKVGSAYVLTNSLVGVGARQIIQSRFAQEAQMARKGATDEAGDKAYQASQGMEVNQFDENLTLTDAQKEKAMKDTGVSIGQDLTFTAPQDQLTPTQQKMATDFIQQWNSRPSSPGSDMDRLSTTQPISLQVNFSTVMSVPSIPGDIVLDDYLGRNDMLRPSDKLRNKLYQQRSEQLSKEHTDDAKPAPAPDPPKPDLTAIFAHLPRRGIIARPQTAADVDKLISQMQTIGLNQLWIDVFSGGESRLTGKPDILTEALTKAKGAGVTIIPVVDPLNWGANTREDLQDLTMSGENSAQADAWQKRYENIAYQGLSLEEADKRMGAKHIFVNPANPSVRETLTSMIAHLAATPGVKTIAISGQIPSGYDMLSTYRETNGYTLGYTLPMRLAFLRNNHVDPIDIPMETYADTPVSHWRIPEFDDWSVQGTAGPKWNEYRAGIAAMFMKDLLAASAAPTGRSAGFLIRSQGSNWGHTWYGLWRDPTTPLPHVTQQSQEWNGGAPSAAGAEARRQSPMNVAIIAPWNTRSQDGLAQSIKEVGPGWDGFVIDFSGDNADLGALEQLASSFAPEKKTEKKAVPAKKP